MTTADATITIATTLQTLATTARQQAIADAIAALEALRDTASGDEAEGYDDGIDDAIITLRQLAS